MHNWILSVVPHWSDWETRCCSLIVIVSKTIFAPAHLSSSFTCLTCSFCIVRIFGSSAQCTHHECFMRKHMCSLFNLLFWGVYSLTLLAWIFAVEFLGQFGCSLLSQESVTDTTAFSYADKLLRCHWTSLKDMYIKSNFPFQFYESADLFSFGKS